jgi:hypothetical protein
VKLNPVGSTLFSTNLKNISKPYTIAADPSGNTYLVDSIATQNLVVTKLSPDGSVVYSSTLCDSGGASSLLILADGTVAVGGTAPPISELQTLDTANHLRKRNFIRHFGTCNRC